MSIPTAKLKAILLYFGNNTDIKFLGKVKLMKLFYFLDFLHLKNYGIPVTFDTYYHLEHGPIPTLIKNLVDTASDDIDSSILSDTISFETPDGTNMSRMIPSRKFTEQDANLLSDSELKILEQVCKRFGDKTTQFIVEASHKEAPWLKTKPQEQISYALAAQDKDCQVSEDEIKLAMKLIN